MHARTKWLRGLGLAAFAAVAFAACDGGTTTVIVPEPEPAPITITATPAQMDLVVGQTQQVVATVSGGAAGTSRAVNFSSSNTAVATVNAQGVVTAVAPGTATIIAAAAADPNVRAGVGVTVRAADVIPPGPDASVTIAGVTQGGTTFPVDPSNVTGQIDVALNVERGNARRLEVLLGNQVVDACTQVFGAANEPQPITAEGLSLQAQTIVCSINTAAYNVVDGQGVPLYANGPHQIRARLVAGDGSTLDAATGPTLTFQNVDFVSVQVSAPNTALDAGGLLWHGGAVTATAVPVSFTGVAISSVTFQARTGATVVATRSDDTGPFSVTFPATGTATQHVRHITADDFNVRVTSVTAAGQPGPMANSANIRLDNLAPVITTQPTNFTGWIGANFAFTATGVGIVAADVMPGVGRLTYQVQVRPQGSTSAAAWTDVSSPADVGERELRDRQFRVVVCDALGNCVVSMTAEHIGVDLTPPTAAIATPAPALINPTTPITVTASDVPSGFAGDFVGVRIVRYTQGTGGALVTRCYNIDTNAVTDPADHAGGVCPFVWRASSTVTVPAGDAYYEITVRVRDQAGNFSDTITRLHLRDNTAPTVSTTGLAFTGTTVTVSGTVSDNVDLAAWDTRLRYGATEARRLLTFSAPTVVGEFGLPLTPSAAAQGTSTIIRGIQAGVGSATFYQLDQVGFGGHDVAGNFGYGGLGFSTTAATAVAGINAFTLTAHPDIVCKTGTTAACTSTHVGSTSTTLRATALSGADTPNPLATVHFYLVRGTHSVYLGSTSTATLVLGAGNVRNWRFELPVAAASLDLGTSTVFAVGVDSKRDGLLSNDVAIDVR
jgi:hypothetical protein